MTRPSDVASRRAGVTPDPPAAAITADRNRSAAVTHGPDYRRAEQERNHDTSPKIVMYFAATVIRDHRRFCGDVSWWESHVVLMAVPEVEHHVRRTRSISVPH